MASAAAIPPTLPARFVPPRRFANGAEWHRALGQVPLERVRFDPWPGGATESGLLRFIEREKCPCELIDGTLVTKPKMNREAALAPELARRLRRHAEYSWTGIVFSAGPVLWVTPLRVRVSDAGYVSLNRLPGGRLRREPVLSVGLELVVEVFTEGNTSAEIDQKLREYFQSGTRLAWVIDPRPRTVAVYHAPGEPARVLDEAGTLDGEQVLPGFSLPVADLFRNLPPAA